ncbi:MAG: hypothetical protein HY517_02540 [Candidatus Aenigmarchaeota archaeon]|nr:hypothetical protein [Candidatus Aenigmarchaeota archaeon]
MKNKGFVGEFKEKETLFFKVTDPKNIIDFVKEVEKTILDKVPELNEYYALQKKPFDVEIFRGPEGMKTIFNHILREERPVCGFVLSGKGRKNMPMYFKQWARDIERKKIDVRYVYVEGISKLWKSVKMKFLPKEYMSPVETEIYGDYVIINMWEPMLLAIRINSKEISDAYRKYFEFIWAIAKSTR